MGTSSTLVVDTMRWSVAILFLFASPIIARSSYHHDYSSSSIRAFSTNAKQLGTMRLFRLYYPSTDRLIQRTSADYRYVVDIRGGSLAVNDNNNDDDANDKMQTSEDTTDITQHPEFDALQSYRMQQQVLLQLRATYLSEALARRGLPIQTISDVGTPDGAIPPQAVDWDCAMSTEDEPMSCLFSFDAEPGTKVVAPLGSTNWIGLATLNRLRREDPSKVEPMWHSKYSIRKSWFDPESDYSLLQHVGVQGFFLNALLQGIWLEVTLAVGMIIVALICMPIIEYAVNRFLVSSFFWNQWPRWYRFAHAALPLKIFIGQFTFGYLSKGFGKVARGVKDILVEWECQILEQSIPLTVGVPDMEHRGNVGNKQDDVEDASFDTAFSDIDENNDYDVSDFDDEED